MDLQLFITINLMAISGLVTLFALIHRARGNLSWIGVNSLVVAAGALGLVYVPQWSGLASAAVFVPLVAAPALLSYLAQRHAGMGNRQASAAYARWAARLHPTSSSRFGAALGTALSHDRVEDNVRALEQLANSSSSEQKLAIAALDAFERSAWAELIEITRRSPAPGANIRALEIRALGELDRPDDMIRLYDNSKTSLPGAELLISQMILLAFSGRSGAVDAILNRQLAHMPEEVRAYWRAVADLNSTGREQKGRIALEDLLRQSTKQRARMAIERRLTPASAPRQQISAPMQRVVNEIEQRVHRGSGAVRLSLARTPVTLLLLAGNLGAFAVEVARGGSEDLQVLVELGAMWAPYVWIDGEWWRLVSATFLHYGPLHLAANLFILSILGRTVEPAYGAMKFSIIYALGGIGSSAAVLASMVSGLTPLSVLIGASGAIFAVFGAEAARQLAIWRHSRDALDQRVLINLGLVLFVQVIIDLSVPEISAAAHISGFLIGFILGLILTPAPSTTRQEPPAP